MKNIIASCLVLLIFESCGPEPQNKYLRYQNIVILSDMSSRLDNRPQKELEINPVFLLRYFQKKVQSLLTLVKLKT
jgi:hypothetical protein